MAVTVHSVQVAVLQCLGHGPQLPGVDGHHISTVVVIVQEAVLQGLGHGPQLPGVDLMVTKSLVVTVQVAVLQGLGHGPQLPDLSGDGHHISSSNCTGSCSAGSWPWSSAAWC